MEKQLRHSRQRDAVLALLKGVTCHPSAEWIYARLKPEHPKISLATVYRNLGLLCEQGEVIRIDVGDGSVHYDAQTFDHTHFFCTECQALSDLGGEEFDGMHPSLERKYGVSITARSVVFYGKCPICKNKKLV